MNKEKRKTSIFGRLLDVVVFIITIVAVVMLLLSYFAKSINPNDAWVFALLGLLAPMLYLINIGLMLYWIIRWRLIFIVPLITLLIGLGGMTLYFRPNLLKNYDKEQSIPENAISIVSFNVAGFIYPLNDRGVSSLDSVAKVINQLKPDILAMQEFQATPYSIKERRINQVFSDLQYNKIKYRLWATDTTGWGLAIYSRYPIVNSGEIEFGNSSNGTIWADIVVAKGDTLRLFNNHLQTTSIKKSDVEFIVSNEFIGGPDNKAKTKKIVKNLRDNFMLRAQQADTVALAMQESPYPLVVCGDFNDTPFSYVYNRIGDGLYDAYREKKEGGNNTYRGLYNLFRIDYVLHSKSYKTLNYTSAETNWSDHKPVKVIIAPLPKEDEK